MKRVSLLSIVGVSLLLTTKVWANQGSAVMRGGTGFIFPDHNSFDNMGQTAMSKGTGVEAALQSSGSNLTMTPSFSYANGRFGFGVYGSRTGTSFTDPNATDTVGGGIGFGIAKDKLNLGVTALRILSATRTSDATVGATLNWNIKKMTVLSLGADTTMNRTGGDLRTGKAGLGFWMSPMVMLEIYAGFNDLSNFGNWSGNAALNYMGKAFYLSSKYTYGATGSTSTLEARAGFVLGKLDISGYTTYVFNGTNQTFGGSARVTF